MAVQHGSIMFNYLFSLQKSRSVPGYAHGNSTFHALLQQDGKSVFIFQWGRHQSESALTPSKLDRENYNFR